MRLMIKLIAKSLRIFLFGIIPLFLITGGSSADKAYANLESGIFQFKLSGSVDYSSSGSASFRNMVEKDVTGHRVNSIKLSFNAKGKDDLELIEFIISLNKSGDKGITAGNYKITNKNLLANGSPGMYGYADLGGSNELPFFVKNGCITVIESKVDGVVGNLEVLFENADQESLHVKGFFNAN